MKRTSAEIPEFAITIHQPWANAIFYGKGGKDVENRSWPTKFRGRIAIHAGAKFDPSLNLLDDMSEFPMSAILGDVEIVDCVQQMKSEYFEGPYGFVLRKPRLYAVPIPFKGRLRIWPLPESAKQDIARILSA